VIRRQLSREVLKERLKGVFETCAPEDYKTKVLKGHLHDAIPYNSGLKVRIELLGADGSLETLKKWSTQNKSVDEALLKLSAKFSSAYGFERKTALETVRLCAEAMGISVREPEKGKTEERTFEQPAYREATYESTDKEVPKASKKNRTPSKRALVRYLLFLVLMSAGFIGGGLYFGTLSKTLEIIRSPFFEDRVILGIIGGLIGILTVMPFIFKKSKLPMFYPMLALLVQVVVAALAKDMPIVYERFQIGIWAVVTGSFILLTAQAAFFPRREDGVSARAISPYYLTGAVYFVTQWAVRATALYLQ
jgi:hypothetical protein